MKLCSHLLLLPLLLVGCQYDWLTIHVHGLTGHETQLRVTTWHDGRVDSPAPLNRTAGGALRGETLRILPNQLPPNARGTLLVEGLESSAETETCHISMGSLTVLWTPQLGWPPERDIDMVTLNHALCEVSLSEQAGLSFTAAARGPDSGAWLIGRPGGGGPGALFYLRGGSPYRVRIELSQELQIPVSADWTRIASDASGLVTWAVGKPYGLPGGFIAHRVAGAWHTEPLPADGFWPADVWISDDGHDVYIVSTEGRIAHYLAMDGTSGRFDLQPLFELKPAVSDTTRIWGVNANDLWIGSGSGVLWRIVYSGSGMDQKNFQTCDNLPFSIEGLAGYRDDLWAVGAGTPPLQSATGMCLGATIPSVSAAALHAIWVGGNAELWAAGQGGRLIELLGGVPYPGLLPRNTSDININAGTHLTDGSELIVGESGIFLIRTSNGSDVAQGWQVPVPQPWTPQSDQEAAAW